MNSVIAIELNNVVSEYVRTHTLTGNPNLDQRIVLICISFLTTYIAVVMAFGKTWFTDKVMPLFNRNKPKDYFSFLPKNRVARIEAGDSNISGNSLYTIISQHLLLSPDKVESKWSVWSGSINSKKEVSLTANTYVGSSKWIMSGDLADMPFQKTILKEDEVYMSKYFYTRFNNRRMKMEYYKTHGNSSQKLYVLIEKTSDEEEDVIRTFASDYFCKLKKEYDARRKVVVCEDVKLYEIRNGEWTKTATLPKKLNSTIVGDTCRNIFSDVHLFEHKIKDVYTSLDIPYKRGYLLYGPPGTGKTSSVRSVASHSKKSIYKITFREKGLGDDEYIALLSKTEEDSIVLFEDVDPLLLQEGGFIEKSTSIEPKKGKGNITENSSGSEDGSKNENGNENKEKKKGKKVTTSVRVSYSTLLDALDGINGNLGRMTFITTNHPDKMGSALLRPGRIDRKFKMDYTSNDEIHEYFQMFYKFFDLDVDTIKEQAALFITNLRNHKRGNKLTFAQLQQFLVQYLEDIEKAVENTHLIYENEEFERYV